ncbi:MAG: hypothetical protein IJJ71_01155 [Treponema sp.]|uniref:hypothetical protein n=1 Tax=Treponema sp. TaxID=166 RepID=UPI0025FA49D8|nr:hypothetical protein [Treponema sp.]MBR0494767.1 hypothetical protein [Treponema sp.]
MNTIDIEEIPEAVRSHKITKKQGAKLIWQDIYTKPQHYGLIQFTEDQKSDFLLTIYKNFEGLFDKFTPGLIPFRAFVAGCISQYKMQFLRRQSEQKSANKTLGAYLKYTMEEEFEKYNITVAEENKEKQIESSRTFSDIITKISKTGDDKRRKLAELTSLVLTMKACNEIDDKIIDSVCEFTGINRELLLKTIQELKEVSAKKAENYKLLVKRRNNAYFYHRKYLHEMLTAEPTEARYEEAQRRYKNQTEKWNRKNEQLSCHSSAPSNKDIAEITGLKTRTVSYYINHAKNSAARLRIRKMYENECSSEPQILEQEQSPE